MKRTLAFSLVALQLLLIATLVLAPRGDLWPVPPLFVLFAVLVGIAGMAIAILGFFGLGPALTASPIPRENASLVTGGVYGLARHPIYTGLMIGGLALAMLGASFWHLALWIALVSLLAGKARWEERMLLDEHPDYAEYAARVGRFLPGIGRLRG